jgi:DNA-binding NtrC family response regulator
VEALLSEISSLLPQILRPTAALLADLVRAKYLRMTGQPAKALEILEPVLTTTREQRYSREEAICLEYMGDCHLAQRDYKKALEHYNQAFQIAEATAPKGDLIPELCHRLAECAVHLGDPNAAILHCERGLRLAKDTGDRYEECATHRVLALAHRAAGNPTKAYRVAAEGIALARAYEIPYELARTLRWTGETRLQSKAREDQMIGRHHLWEARAIFDRIGLANQVRMLDRHLGFEEESETRIDEAGAEALLGISSVDRGALRFGIVTASPEISQAVATIQSVAPSRIPVLIAGASGVGKELLAIALHQMSDRRKGPFVAVNCGALSPGILDSELFGHERGAFTGAISAREGIFATADHGTLFLDEIGELPPPAQATLLRVLETGEFRPVGGDEVRTIDVRIVAATNADLENLVVRGIFRRDLYYRLEGVCVTVPPLAEREEDIRALFRFFFAKAIAAAGKRLTVAEDVEPMLCAYGWPGNVRELKNEIARVVAMAGTGSVIGRDAFLPKLKGRSPAALRQARDRHGAEAEERDRIIEALRAHRGNKADAARSLGGMKRTTLLYKIDRLGIRPEEYQTKEG